MSGPHHVSGEAAVRVPPAAAKASPGAEEPVKTGREGLPLAVLLERVRRGMAAEDSQELLRAMLEEAARVRASDVHLDPSPRGYDLLFRVDGVLRPMGSVEEERGVMMVRSLKSQAGLDPGFALKPQAGRADYADELGAVSVRVATAPGVRGEKMALRLLSEDGERLPLHELGMGDEAHAALLHCIADVRGMIVVSGPAGAGKTTTLYALLRELASTGRSIVSVEDPVEFMLDGVTQMQVNEKQGFDFAEGVRSMLRLDPDIIVMGEMRDAASARAALHAADTGHVCLSTVHARDAAGTITAMRNYGCLDHEIAASLDLIISQRLVRRLCAQCRREEGPSAVEAEFLVSLGQKAPPRVWHAPGCAACGGTGYHGRIGVFEVHRMREEDADLFISHAEERAIRRQMRRGGSRSLTQDVLRHVRSGVTSVDEIRRGFGLGFFGTAEPRGRRIK